MRTVPVLGLFGALVACGGSSDHTGGDLAAKYAGLWTGTLTSTVGGSSTTRTGAKLAIEEIRPDQVKLRGYCSATDIYGEGPTATVSASGLTLDPLVCTFASTTCPTVTADIKSGSGSLTGPLSATLNLALTAVVTDCAGTGTDLLTYTATAKAAYGSMALGAPILER
jgi:hypothetical protein